MSDSRDVIPTQSEATIASLANYIAEMAGELATMANRSELTMLAYFLNLARVEAETKSREAAAVGDGR
ncbi:MULTISPECIES: hypothetical protein [Methylosinus]|nr:MULTISPECIES: hypothetical protein [Methylosinus]MBU3886913.1 hypothetical protein [Methylosinus sp. KRF6]TRL26545.1 hypothetical protein FM996_19570 [Methylosinus sporium]